LGFENGSDLGEHGTGIGDLLDQVFDVLEFEAEVEELPAPEPIKVAIHRTAQCRKITLLNQILGEERVYSFIDPWHDA